MAGRPPGEDGLFDDADETDPTGGGGRGLIPDGVKKAILSGVGALFMTEEGVRGLARDWKLPKELIGYLGQQAQGAKEEILRVLSDEIRRFLESDAVRRELGKALTTMALEVKAEIRLRPLDADGAGGGPLRPEVKASVRPGAPAADKPPPRREPAGKRRR